MLSIKAKVIIDKLNEKNTMKLTLGVCKPNYMKGVFQKYSNWNASPDNINTVVAAAAITIPVIVQLIQKLLDLNPITLKP